jgi:hypothetical protein
VKVTTVEIKDVEIPDRMQHAIARQAEAERERRAKVINAEGEFQAAARLSDAADLISRNPTTIQLRALQTLMEISGNTGNTIVFPVPMNLLVQPGVVKPAEAVVPTANGPEPARLHEALEVARAALGTTSVRVEDTERPPLPPDKEREQAVTNPDSTG